jgi:hypothetical protein
VRPIASEIAQPIVPRTSDRRGLEPREEEQEDEADVGEDLGVGVGLRDVEHLGADQDPEHDLDDDVGRTRR